LVAYKHVQGDCNVPHEWKNNPELAKWCQHLRASYKKNQLSSDRVTRLKKIGFMWDPLATAWEKMFAALVVYRQTHGDCNVPIRWKGDPELGNWCRTQRSVFKRNALSQDRFKRLEQLGFVWDPFFAAWEEMFSELIAYKKAHGDCNVPKVGRGEDNAALGNWCSRQRFCYKSKQLAPDRITRMEQLGFVWDAHTAAWDGMFAALVAYKQIHGDCNVPQGWKDNPVLGKWCQHQRASYKKNQLSLHRVTRLKKLGFI
jgi:hypothetical protein